MTDYVILVNEKNEVIGQAEKLLIHNANTPVHRGFSIFLFNKKRELLLQRRSLSKKTWRGVWSNSCCGHPMLGESPEDAAKRRLKYELGITEVDVTMILPDYRYRFEREGIVENEFCPVMVGVSDQKPIPNPDEVEAIQWILWRDWLKKIHLRPQDYSEWSVEETNLLGKNGKFREWIGELG